MVAFNEGSLPTESIPNFTTRSQGTGVDRSFEALFSGMMDTAQNVMQIKDQATEDAIYKEADSTFQAINREFGFDPDQSNSTSIEQGDAAGTPPGLQDGVDRMATLQAAFEQGKINEVNYYGRLATLTKQLRSKYPGYEKVVDATVQSVTGTRPANAYRDALLSSIKAMQEGASDAEKFRRQYVKENGAEIYALYGEDFEVAAQNLDMMQLQKDVSMFKAQRDGIKARTAELELAAKEDADVSRKAAKTLDQDLTFTVNSISNAAFKVNGQTTTVMARINQLATAGSASPEAVKEFISHVTSLEGNVRAEAQKTADRYVAKGWITRDEANKSVEAAMENIARIKEAVVGGDFKLAGALATVNKVIEDKSLSDLFSADPRFKAGAGLQKINQAAGEQYLNTGTWAMDTADKVAAAEVTGQIISGNSGALKTVVENAPQQTVRDTLQTVMNVFRSPSATPEAINTLTKELFGVGGSSVNWMDPRVVKEEDQEKLYLLFTNPSVTKQIFEKGDEDAKRFYTEWARSGAANIPSIRRLGNELMDAQNWGGVQIEWDQKSGQFVMPIDNTFLGTSTGKYFVDGARSLNRVLRTLEPIAEAQGIDKEEFALDFLGSLRLQYGDRDNRSIFVRMYQALESEMRAGEPGADSGTIIPKADDGAVRPRSNADSTRGQVLNFLPEGMTDAAAVDAIEDAFDLEDYSDLDFVDGDGEDLGLPEEVDVPDAAPSGRGRETLTDTPGRNDPVTDAGQFLLKRTDKPASHIRGLNNDFQSRLAAMMQDPSAPPGLGIYSGYRSPQRQAELWAAALRKYGSVQAARKWVAPPGRSNHNHGMAADLSYNGKSLAHAPRHVVEWVHKNAAKYKLKFPLSNENWHVEMAETRRSGNPLLGKKKK